VFFSDAHLALEPHESERSIKLRRFLATLAGNDVSDLYVLGDLFDFWFEYRTAIFSAYFPVLRALATLSEGGVRLHYIVGNHDYWVGTFLENAIGFTVHKEAVALDIDGTGFFLCHGDGLNRRDYGYRAFRRIAQWKPAIALFRTIHPDLALKLGKMVSGLSRQLVNAETPGRLREAEAVRQYAVRTLRDCNVDIFIAGHCHIPTDERIEVDGRIKRYVNVGDWLTHFTYAELSGGHLALRKFTEEGESPESNSTLQ
jgi:UDP-2,3-diacylglucosamine hydrolase